MSSFDDAPSTLVSTKLQGVALRTPPPSDTYVMECIVHPSDEEFDEATAKCLPVVPPTRRILRLTNHASALDVLYQLHLVSDSLLFASHSSGSYDENEGNAISITQGGIQTQLFALHPASGDGTPFVSTREANLLTKAPIRESLSLRFPFTIAITPSLVPARTAGWSPAQWRAALMAQHNARLNVVNGDHVEREASMRKPLSGADVIKSSAVAENSLRTSSLRHQNNSQYSFLTHPSGHHDDETNIIVTPAAASNNLSLPTSPQSPTLGFGVPPLFASDEAHKKRSSLSISSGNTPRSPMGATERRNTSSPNGAGASPAPSNLTYTTQTRQEKRNAAQVERQRLQDLQRLREQNIARLEQKSQHQSTEMGAHVAAREHQRAVLAEEERKVVAERQARMDSRTVRSLESKRSMQEQHAVRLLTKKLEYQQLMEEALRRSQGGGGAPATEEESFKEFGAAASQSAFGFLALSGPVASGSAMNHSRSTRSKSVVELPDATETELSRLELEQAKTNFVNRVAASRKATDRRMSRFSTVKLHPFVVHAELQSLLGQLDASAHNTALETETLQRAEREREHEHATSEYHRRVMDDSIQKRVAIKMERKINSIEHHAQLIAFEKVKKQADDDVKRKTEADAKARMMQFYEKKQQQEVAAKEMARAQKEMSEYVERQKQALRGLVAGEAH